MHVPQSSPALRPRLLPLRMRTTRTRRWRMSRNWIMSFSVSLSLALSKCCCIYTTGWSTRIIHHSEYFNFRLNIQVDKLCFVIAPKKCGILTCCCCIEDVAIAGGCCCHGCITVLDSESVTRGPDWPKSWLGVGDLRGNIKLDPSGQALNWDDL